MSVGRSIAKQILLGGLTQFLVSFRGLIIMPIIVKTAGDSVFGAYVLLSSIVVFISGISSFGTNYTFRRELPSTDTGRQRCALLMPPLTFRIFSTAAFATLLYFGSPGLFGMFGESIPFSPEYLVIWLLGLLFQEKATDYYRYTSRFGIYNLLTLGQIYIHIGAIIGVVLFWHDLSLDTLLLLQGSSLVILSLPTLVLGVFRETGLSWPQCNWRNFWTDARLGLPLTGEFIVDFLVAFGDRYLIGLFLSLAAVGQYQSSYALAGLLAFLPKVLGSVLPPPLCRLWDDKKHQQAEQLVSNALRLFLIIAIPFMVGALIIGPSVVAALTTPEMAFAGRWAVALIAIGMLFYGIIILLSSVAFVTRQTSVIFTANLIAIVGNVALNLVFLSIWPTVTVPAAVSAIVYGIAFSYALYKVRKHFSISFHWSSLIRSILATLVMSAVLCLTGYTPGTIGSTDILVLGLTVFAAMVSYFAVFLVIGGLPAVDRAALAILIRQHRN
ncbi:polysaccharide biosynthesis C-terminal domain-containing protein [Thalassospira lohafexi]|nr:lipopolysaccharide biosynthesis protein [Thalassospira lohafexi]